LPCDDDDAEDGLPSNASSNVGEVDKSVVPDTEPPCAPPLRLSGVGCPCAAPCEPLNEGERAPDGADVLFERLPRKRNLLPPLLCEGWGLPCAGGTRCCCCC